VTLKEILAGGFMMSVSVLGGYSFASAGWSVLQTFLVTVWMYVSICLYFVNKERGKNGQKN
jgi:hypothetical protein